MAKEKDTALETTNQDMSMVASAFDAFKVKDGQMSGFEDFRESDLKIPRVKLVQLTSKEVADKKAQPGQFINLVSGKVYDELNVNLFLFNHQRVMWPEKFSRNSGPLCRSLDAETGTDMESGELINCDKCPNSKWGKDNTPPRCSAGYSWFGYIPEEDTLFRMATPPSSMSDAKNFINIGYNLLSTLKLPLYIWNVKLSSASDSNESGTYYVMKFNIPEQTGDKIDELKYEHITPETAHKLQGQLKAYGELFQQLREEDLVTAESNEDYSGGTIEGSAIV